MWCGLLWFSGVYVGCLVYLMVGLYCGSWCVVWAVVLVCCWLVCFDSVGVMSLYGIVFYCWRIGLWFV